MNTDLKLTNLQCSIMQGLIGFAAVTLVLSGCASGTKISQNAKGGVYLEEVTDWSFEASHPAVIDQLTMTKIVKGLYGNEGTSGSSRMSAGGSKPMRLFSDEDAEFLAPLLAQSLSKAKPEQLVGFRVSSSAGSGSEPTTGSMYVSKGSIYVTIGKGAKQTLFMPESAARIEPAPAYAAGGTAGAMAMIIDYHALAKVPMPAAMASAKATQAAPVSSMAVASASKSQAMPVNASEEEPVAQNLGELAKVKEALARKDSEISMLRKESEWMKRELRERDEEMRAIKSSKVSAKPAPKKKTAEATPSR